MARTIENILEILSLQIVRKRIWPCTAGHDVSDTNSELIVNCNYTFAQSVVNELLYEKWDSVNFLYIMVKMRNFKIILVMRAGQRAQKHNA